MATPSLRDRLRPLELLVLSAVLGVFAGGVVLFSTRELMIALIAFGVAFIVGIMVIAMLALAMKPDDAERLDLAQQDREEQDRAGH